MMISTIDMLKMLLCYFVTLLLCYFVTSTISFINPHYTSNQYAYRYYPSKKNLQDD